MSLSVHPHPQSQSQVQAAQVPHAAAHAQLAVLERAQSANTTLISLYVKGGPNLTGAFFAKELSASANIKSKQTRSGVQAALKSLQRELKVRAILAFIAKSQLHILISDDASQHRRRVIAFLRMDWRSSLPKTSSAFR